MTFSGGQLRALNCLLLLCVALQFGPQGPVACLRADGSRSYGSDCSCDECKQPAQSDQCCCGSGQSCHDGDGASALHVAFLAPAVEAIAPAAHHTDHICCADHRLFYQAAASAQAPQRAAAELIAEPLPSSRLEQAACAVLSPSLARPKAPPGRTSPDQPGILILRI